MADKDPEPDAQALQPPAAETLDQAVAAATPAAASQGQPETGPADDVPRSRSAPASYSHSVDGASLSSFSVGLSVGVCPPTVYDWMLSTLADRHGPLPR